LLASNTHDFARPPGHATEYLSQLGKRVVLDFSEDFSEAERKQGLKAGKGFATVEKKRSENYSDLTGVCWKGDPSA
jgi:hypothetical protein